MEARMTGPSLRGVGIRLAAVTVATLLIGGCAAHTGNVDPDAGGVPTAATAADLATAPNAGQLDAYLTAYNLTSRVAYLLDRLSDTPTDSAAEAGLLAEVGQLLADDVTVDTDGRVFTGRQAVLDGMRFAHSRLQDGAKRLETSPTILRDGLRSRPATFTIATVQQHTWTDPATGERRTVNRDTEVTIKRVGHRWLVASNTLRTAGGGQP
jgi:hypothetical protein